MATQSRMWTAVNHFKTKQNMKTELWKHKTWDLEKWLIKVKEIMKWQQKETDHHGQNWIKSVVTVFWWENFLCDKRQTKLYIQQNNSGIWFSSFRRVVKIEYYLLLGSSLACDYKVSTFRKYAIHVLWRWRRHMFPKRRHFIITRRGTTQKKIISNSGMFSILCLTLLGLIWEWTWAFATWR
jgi:hypothetical protein